MSQVAPTKNNYFVATIDLVVGCIYEQIIPKFASKSVWIRQTLGILAFALCEQRWFGLFFR